ncbi:MAG TPA: protein phosphatase 2C domain-containing protein [Firmicutes bacterium]|nr:protein phosphatase 2C domain-containing protein [Bacillota bacterium]
MDIDIFTYSNIGSRPLNEDSFGIKNDDNRCVAVLCDGLGGYNCGEIASKTAVDNIIEGISKIVDLQADSIYNVLKFVNDGLLQQQIARPELSGMRTTAVGCIIDKTELNYFNSGDSRFYFFSNGALRAMSKDHSVSQMSVELGEMPFDNIRFDKDRNKLLKVLGDRANSDVGTIYRPLTYKSGDAFLLCSDGFWEYVLEEEMEIDLSKSNTAKEWIEFMLIRLLIKFNGNNDNFTVIGGIIK